MIYIATFYSHFGTIQFKKMCDCKNVNAKMMPVPRNLSSSCGTCVRYTSDNPCPFDAYPEEMEQIVEVAGDSYKTLYRAENS